MQVIPLVSALVEAVPAIRRPDEIVFPWLHIERALKFFRIAVDSRMKQKAVCRKQHQRLCIGDDKQPHGSARQYR